MSLTEQEKQRLIQLIEHPTPYSINRFVSSLHTLHVFHGNKISYKLDKGYIVDIVLDQRPFRLNFICLLQLQIKQLHLPD